jgi:hypothetical protein
VFDFVVKLNNDVNIYDEGVLVAYKNLMQLLLNSIIVFMIVNS